MKAASLDKAGAAGAQAMRGPADEGLGVDGLRRSQLRVRTVVTLRWLVLAVEVMSLVAAWLWLGIEPPYVLAFAVIAAGAWLNILTAISSPGQRVFSDLEAAGQLALDIVQIGLVVFLTGGAANPFILLLIAPVTLAGATLPLKPVLSLGGLGALVSLALAFTPFPLISILPLAEVVDGHRIVAALANIAGMVLIAGHVRHAATESARMALALDVTQAVLAREQRLSALGALAAAAAHELGTPLATIAIVAKELAREAPTPGVKEDADLLIAQAQRCREILRRLTDAPDAASDEVHERLSLRQLVQEVIESHSGAKGVRVEAIVTGAPGVKAPDIRRLPEITHAMTSFVENAIDFATSEVLVSARFDAEAVSVEVRDDGPGFSPEILAKLGEPYVTSRPGAEGSRTGHIGMGLGLFISKTLLERTGATVTFHNGRPRGAVVSARWPRSRVEISGG